MRMPPVMTIMWIVVGLAVIIALISMFAAMARKNK